MCLIFLLSSLVLQVTINRRTFIIPLFLVLTEFDNINTLNSYQLEFFLVYLLKKNLWLFLSKLKKYIFLDWLVSRRICPSDWQKDILTVRKNINNAIQDMPAIDEIAQMLAGTCMY